MNGRLNNTITLQWQWTPIGPKGKEGRVYTFPLTFGPSTVVKMEKRDDSLQSLPEWLDDKVEGGELDLPTSQLVLSLASAGKIVSAISRYPVARQRAGSNLERYSTAAETAFTGEQYHSTQEARKAVRQLLSLSNIMTESFSKSSGFTYFFHN